MWLVVLNRTIITLLIHLLPPSLYTVTVTIPLKVWVKCLSLEQKSDGNGGGGLK